MDVFNGHGKRMFVGAMLDEGPTPVGVAVSTVNGDQCEAQISLPPDQARLAASAILRYAGAIDGQRSDLEKTNEAYFELGALVEEAILAICGAANIDPLAVLDKPEHPLMQIAAELLRRDIAAPLLQLVAKLDEAKRDLDVAQGKQISADAAFVRLEIKRAEHARRRASADRDWEFAQGRIGALLEVLEMFGYHEPKDTTPVTIPGAESNEAVAAGTEAAE